MNTPTQNITIFHDTTKEWNTDIEGEIGEIRVDGKKLNDIHDLATKIDKMASVIKILAFVATFLAIVAVAGIVAIGSWLATNHGKIISTMDTTEDLSQSVKQLKSSNVQMRLHLRELGWEWKHGRWQQIGNNPVNPSK